MSAAIGPLPPEKLKLHADAYRAATAAKRNRTLMGIGVIFVLMILSGVIAEVRLITFAENINRFFSYLGRIFMLENGALVFTDPAEWFWGLRKWLVLLWETLIIAYIGTLLGAVFGFLLCFVAAGNITKLAWARIAAKRFLEFCRTVPELVFALIFVSAFGLGPLPGVLAIMIHTMGALGKLYSEVVENIDMKPVEASPPPAAHGRKWCAMRSCRRCSRTSRATRCCASRSMCAARP